MTARIDIQQIQKIHFIGIGGIGMSALARHFLREKKTVSGSDRTLTDITKALASEGVQIFSEQTAENIASDVDLFVYTEAMAADHEEMLAAKKLKVPMVNYFEALGLAMNPYYLIAVAGTHGKTTTTAMLTDIFEAEGKDPTAIIGSLRAKTHSNYRAGKSKYAIVEACEYKRDFLHLTPDILVITNLELEHVDYYTDLADVQSAFRTLATQVNEGGVVVADLNDPNVAPIVAGLDVRVVNYQDYLDLTFPLKQPGVHNRMNAAAAIATAKQEKIDVDSSKGALGNFAGTWRRFEYKGELNGAQIYDEYAHHPTEIIASLLGARELYPNKNIRLVFQPHTFSRTAALFDAFSKAVGQADDIYILPVYSAREENVSGVTSRELAVKTLEVNPNVQYVATVEEVENQLRQVLSKDDVLVVMGAGDVTKLADNLTK
jgi:UDP-N-acetylmuramate--alanine ligase